MITKGMLVIASLSSPPLLCSTREGLFSDNLVVTVCYLVEKLSHLSFNQGISLSSNG